MEEDFVCYFCNRVAEYNCDECNKYVCATHFSRNVHQELLCDECYKKMDAVVSQEDSIILNYYSHI